MRRSVLTIHLLALAIAFGCGGGTGLPTAPGGPEVPGGGDLPGGGGNADCGADFGAEAAAQKLEAFIAATNQVQASAEAIQNGLLDACKRMGQSLGMSEGELSGSGADGTRSVCNAVAGKLRDEMSSVRGSAGVTVTLQTIPPQCAVSVNAYAECAGTCEARVDPGEVQVECEGGELRGGCTAECTGSCSVDVEARCTGTCEGACDGRCSATAEDGSCNGQCRGDCHGHCVAQASGQCSGECRGGCSVAFTEPRCTGHVRPPSVSAECQASCDANMDAQMTCEPGRVELEVTGRVGTDLRAKVEALKAAFLAGFGEILAIKVKIERLVASVGHLIEMAADLPAAVASVGLSATSCIQAQLQAVTGTMSGSLTVSVEVSASVSGSAAAGK